MDTDTLKRDLDTFHAKKRGETDRFTALIIFASNHDFPAFAKKWGIGYKAVMGLYKGIIEESFVINNADGSHILAEGILRGQETVLLLSPQEAVFGGAREVWLATVDESGLFLEPAPSPKFIGHWHKVGCSEALHSDAWTCYPDDPAWYVVKMPETYLTPRCDNRSQ